MGCRRGSAYCEAGRRRRCFGNGDLQWPQGSARPRPRSAQASCSISLTALLNLLSCCHVQAEPASRSLHCGHDIRWHFIRTKLNEHFYTVPLDSLLKVPMERPFLRSRPHAATGGWITDLPGPWELLWYCHHLMMDNAMYVEASCTLGRLVFVSLNLVLQPNSENFGEVARCFSHVLRLGLSIAELMSSGWPVWPLIELAVQWAKLKGVRYGSMPLSWAALGPPGRGNVTLPATFHTVLRAATRLLAEVALRVPAPTIMGPAELRALRGAGAHLMQAAHANLGQTMWLLVAGLPLWRLLALVHRLRVLRGGCPAGALMLQTRELGPVNDTWAEVPSVSICVRRSPQHPIDAFLVQTGSFPDCAALLRSAGPAEAAGDDLAIDVGANIGACALLLAQVGYRLVALEPQPLEAEMLRASAKANGFLAPGVRRLRVVQAVAANSTGTREVLLAHQNKFNEVRSSSPPGFTAGGPLWVGMMIRPRARDPTAAESRLAQISSEKVPAVRLDDLGLLAAAEAGRLALLKVDAEMHEEEVFAGGRSLLLAAAHAARVRAAAAKAAGRRDMGKPRPLVHFEYEPQQLEALGLDPHGPPRLLARLGYSIFDAKGQEVNPKAFAQFAGAIASGGNMQARPKVQWGRR